MLRRFLPLAAVGTVPLVIVSCDVDMPWDHEKLAGDYTLHRIEGATYLEYRKVLVSPGGKVLRIGRDGHYLVVERELRSQPQVFDFSSDRFVELTSQQIKSTPELKSIVLLPP